MTDSSRRRELQAEYRRNPPEAGVFAFRNRAAGKVLIGSARNLPSMRSKLEFARKMGSPSALDRGLHADARTYGLDALEFEVLEVLPIEPSATVAQIASDLATLESLWRERFEAAELYQ
jgi:hypothetical protein